MKTIAETIRWLESPQVLKGIFVNVTNVDDGTAVPKNFYFSTISYYNSALSIEYLPIITNELVFTESLSITGDSSISYGSIELENTAGVYDSWLPYIWYRRPIEIYLGDPSWSPNDFVLVFKGLVNSLELSSENTLSLSITNNLENINDTLHQKTVKDLGNSYSEFQNSAGIDNNTVIPLLFGEAFNISPILVHNGRQDITPAGIAGQFGGTIYKFHDGDFTNGDIIEVRENGVPLSDIDASKDAYSESRKNLAEWEFKIQVSGTVTCSARSKSIVDCTVPKIILDILKNYGPDSSKIATASINDFSNITNTSKVGVYYPDRVNKLDACNQIAKSINCNLIHTSITVETSGTTSEGKFKLIELKDPSTMSFTTYNSNQYISNTVELNDDSMIEGTFNVSESFSPKQKIKLAYCKNYTIQEQIAAGLDPRCKFHEEYWFQEISSATATTDPYADKNTTEPETTCLLDTAEALAEAQKRFALWNKPRYIVSARYLPRFIFLQLGDIVSINSQRRFWPANAKAMIFSISRNWVTGLVDIGVLI